MFQSHRWLEISSMAKDLVSCMLEKNNKSRIKISEIFKHKWIASAVS